MIRECVIVGGMQFDAGNQSTERKATPIPQIYL
jgi:hypothetical protein